MMNFIFEVKDKLFVTDEEYEQLEWLRFKDGFIWPAFNEFDGYVVIAKDDFDEIVGWGFVFRYPGEIQNTFYVYTKKEFRKMKIGSTIYKLALSLNDGKKFNVSKWSTTAAKFYKSLGR